MNVIGLTRLIKCFTLVICVFATQNLAEGKSEAKKEMMRIGDEIVSPDAGKLFVKAQEYLDGNQLEQAATLLKQFIESYPNSATGHYKLGFVLLQQNKNTDALEQAKRCTELKEKFSNGWALLGEASMNLKLKQQAIDAYHKALAIQSTGENADVIREHLDELTKPASANLNVNDDLKNQEITNQNNAIMKTNRALSLCNQANEFLKQRQFEQGLEKCRSALKITPGSEQVKENVVGYLNNYASDCVKQQNLTQAEALIKEAIDVQSKGGVTAASRRTTLSNYAVLLKFLGRDDEAKAIEEQIKAIK